jgi:nitrogen fixation protein FixH
MSDDLFSGPAGAAPRPPSPALPQEAAGRREPRELTGGMVLALLLAFFAVIFAVNGVLVHKALSTFAGVETESSYKAGQSFEREVAKSEAQDARRWQITGQVTRAADGTAVLDIVARDVDGATLTGLDALVTFERPTDRRLDRTMTVGKDGAGHFRGRANIAAGQWDLVIELWRQGERQFRSINRIVLQ